jgi:DNA invertase Pin-like site-specific DNA recombinase
MRELLERIESGELVGVAAFSLDRLSRDPGHGDELVKRITRAGGVVLTPDIPDALDSPTGEFTFGMLLQVAKLYRSQAGARFQSAKERAIKAGIPVGDPPIGYRRGADRRLELDPDTAPLVRELYELRARGERAATLSDLLTERTGRRWSLTGVERILENRLYATGRLEYGGIVSDFAAEPVVDDALWHAVQRVSLQPRAPRGTGTSSGWLLTGLVRCASCGGAMSPHTTTHTRASGARKTYRRYRCRNRACADKGNVQADRLERWVIIETLRVEHELETLTTGPDLDGLEAELAASERRLEQVLTPEAQDALGDAWASTAKARRQERDNAAAELGMARREAGTEARTFNLRELVEEGNTQGLREGLRFLWKAIHVGRPGPDGTPLVLVSRGSGVAELTVELPAVDIEMAA